jgi:hypothetical protein
VVSCSNCQKKVKPTNTLQCPECQDPLIKGNGQNKTATKKAPNYLTLIVAVICIIMTAIGFSVYSDEERKLVAELDMVYEAAFLIDNISGEYENQYKSLLESQEWIYFDGGYKMDYNYISSLTSNFAKGIQPDTMDETFINSRKIAMVRTIEDSISHRNFYRLDKTKKLLDSAAIVFSRRHTGVPRMIMSRNKIDPDTISEWIYKLKDVTEHMVRYSLDEKKFGEKITFLQSNDVFVLRNLKSRISKQIVIF